MKAWVDFNKSRTVYVIPIIQKQYKIGQINRFYDLSVRIVYISLNFKTRLFFSCLHFH